MTEKGLGLAALGSYYLNTDHYSALGKIAVTASQMDSFVALLLEYLLPLSEPGSRLLLAHVNTKYKFEKLQEYLFEFRFPKEDVEGRKACTDVFGRCKTFVEVRHNLVHSVWHLHLVPGKIVIRSFKKQWDNTLIDIAYLNGWVAEGESALAALGTYLGQFLPPLPLEEASSTLPDIPPPPA